MEEKKLMEYKSLADVEKDLPNFTKKGIKEFTLHDKVATADKNKLLHFLSSVEKYCPDLYLTIPVTVAVLDAEVCRVCSNLYCSLDIPFTGSSKPADNGSVYLFDKKRYAGKASMLNDTGLVFGFDMDYATLSGDSIKLFRERFDFAVSLYPNHIDFAQLETQPDIAKPTATFSTQDIRYARDMAFACKTFYSAGRSVPWFLSVLAPLKIQPSKFFADFAEWQRCNNCNISSGFAPDSVGHLEIEKMQLIFLSLKYEEKHKETMFSVVKDIVRLNGAFSRLVGEGETTELELSYNPDDLFSPDATNIASFAENVMLEPCHVKIFDGKDGPDYKVLD